MKRFLLPILLIHTLWLTDAHLKIDDSQSHDTKIIGHIIAFTGVMLTNESSSLKAENTLNSYDRSFLVKALYFLRSRRQTGHTQTWPAYILYGALIV